MPRKPAIMISERPTSIAYQDSIYHASAGAASYINHSAAHMVCLIVMNELGINHYHMSYKVILGGFIAWQLRLPHLPHLPLLSRRFLPDYHPIQHRGERDL